MNNATNITPRVKRKRSSALFQLFLAAAILLVIWLSFGQNVLSPQKESEIPQHLGALKLADSTTGAEAMAEINKLHGTDIKLVTAYIATYALNNERLTAWVGKAEDDAMAGELIERMVKAISDGNPGFSNLKRLSIAQGYHNHEVFQVDGPGGRHFFYISKLSRDRVVWLTIPAGDAMPLVETALDTF